MKMTRNSVIADFRAAVYDYPEEESRNRLDRMLIWLSVSGFEAEVKVCLDYFESVVGRALQFERIDFSNSHVIGFGHFDIGLGKLFRDDVKDLRVYRGFDEHRSIHTNNFRHEYIVKDSQGSISKITVRSAMLHVRCLSLNFEGYWTTTYLADEAKIDLENSTLLS